MVSFALNTGSLSKAFSSLKQKHFHPSLEDHEEGKGKVLNIFHLQCATSKFCVIWRVLETAADCTGWQQPGCLIWRSIPHSTFITHRQELNQLLPRMWRQIRAPCSLHTHFMTRKCNDSWTLYLLDFFAVSLNKCLWSKFCLKILGVFCKFTPLIPSGKWQLQTRSVYWVVYHLSWKQRHTHDNICTWPYSVTHSKRPKTHAIAHSHLAFLRGVLGNCKDEHKSPFAVSWWQEHSSTTCPFYTKTASETLQKKNITRKCVSGDSN